MLCEHLDHLHLWLPSYYKAACDILLDGLEVFTVECSIEMMFSGLTERVYHLGIPGDALVDLE